MTTYGLYFNAKLHVSAPWVVWYIMKRALARRWGLRFWTIYVISHVSHKLASWGGCHHFAAPQGFLEEQTGDDIVDLDEIGAHPSTPFSFLFVSLMAIALQW